MRLPLKRHSSELLLVGDKFEEGGRYVAVEVPLSESESWNWLGDGLRIPREMSVQSTSTEYECDVSARYDEQAGRYITQRVTVTARDGHEVTGETLRGIRVAELLRHKTQGTLAHLMPRWPRELAEAGPTVETLQAVAVIYRLALMLGDSPTQAVAEELGIPRSTAGRWVTRSRDRGFLSVVDPRAGKDAQ